MLSTKTLALALAAITPKDRGILAFLQTIGIGPVELDEVASEFLVNPVRARAMAKDLGWTSKMMTTASHRGFADTEGNYSPEIYEAAQRQARARAAAKRATASARKQARRR
jgi:hypothetical protein